MTNTLRVLVLEDRPTDAELMLHELSRAGHTLEWQQVSTAEEYLTSLGLPWDIILADYSLPQFDALRALRMLQARSLDIPFIIVTGSIGEEVAVECMREGATDYLLKDRLARLGQAVSHALQEKRLRDEKWRAEAALRESEALNQAVLSSLTAHIAVLAADGTIIGVNKAWNDFARESGAPTLANTGVGINYLDVCRRAEEEGAQFAKGAKSGIEAVLNGSRTYFNLEYPAGSAEDKRWFLLYATPLAGTRGGAVVSHNDITGRKRAEEVLRRYTERLIILHEIDEAILAAQSPEEIAHAALNGIRQLLPARVAGIVLFDLAAGTATIFALDKGFAMSLSAGMRFPLAAFGNLETIGTGQVLMVGDLAASTDLIDVERRVQAEGVRSYMAIPLIATGKLIGSLNIGSDQPHCFTNEDSEIARQVADQLAIALYQAQLHQELARTNVELEEALRLKEEMIQNVSHELRTPLTQIVGYGDLMADGAMGDLTAEQFHAVRVIRDRAQALSRLVNTLLSFRKLTPQYMQWEQVDLRALATDTTANWREMASRKQIAIDVQIVGEPPLVCGDEQSLQQAIDQVLDNALKFTSQGGSITLRVEHHEDEVWLSVSDTGIGIPPDKLIRVFDRFFQVDGSTTRRHGGMGIGLSLVQEIVALHNGRVYAESDGIPGHGSTITIALPLTTKKP